MLPRWCDVLPIASHHVGHYFWQSHVSQSLFCPRSADSVALTNPFIRKPFILMMPFLSWACHLFLPTKAPLIVAVSACEYSLDPFQSGKNGKSFNPIILSALIGWNSSIKTKQKPKNFPHQLSVKNPFQCSVWYLLFDLCLPRDH